MKGASGFRSIGLAFASGLLALLAGLPAAPKGGPLEPESRPRAASRLLEGLLRLPPQASVLQVSSHNKKGRNGDADWPLYRDEKGDDVIFDAAGPGCIRSMWGTNFDPEGIVKFYFDGEETPRFHLKLIDFYRGEHPLFPRPLVSYEQRGVWGEDPYAGNSFVPIPFARWLKIAVQGESRFFHIIYEVYPYPRTIPSFTGKEDRSALLDAFARTGESPFDPGGLATHAVEKETVEPGQTVSLLKLEKAAGIIREIRIEADGAPDFFQKTLLRMRWDGHPRWDVQAPPGIFFGSAVKADEMRTLPLRVEKLPGGRVRLRCFFPMAFWESAEIEWANTTARRMATLRAEVLLGKNEIPKEEGTYFAALYHAGETIYGRDWLLFEGQGSGWLAGVVQSMRESHYCEGNEHFVLDGAVSPQFNGTGSEDYYLACFWPNVDFDSPFASVAGNVQEEGGGEIWGAYHVPSSYCRLHLEAPLPFFSSLNARIQHGGQSDVLSAYRSIAFCYLQKRRRLAQTDMIDVGNAESERMHGYGASAGGPAVQVEASPEGEYLETLLGSSGRYHREGEVRFRVALNPQNRGVRLRRLLDQKVPRQKALVYVDGRYAGCWYHGAGNEFLRWYESDFEIHADFCRGKESLEVRLEVKTDRGEGPFTDFRYEIYCYSF